MNLDEVTRKYMLEEIDMAIKQNNLYDSARFNDIGKQKWPSLLREATEKFNEHWLAYQIEANRMMKGMETVRIPSGGYTIKHVPHIAAETLAEGQFNRYYILAICRRAISEGKHSIIVYRAKERQSPRPESEQLIDKQLDPNAIINEIRPVASSLKSELLKPNSGLSIKI